MSEDVKLTSFGPMGPAAIAAGLREPLRHLRAAIEAVAAEEHAGSIPVNSEYPIGRAVEGIAAAICAFADGATPPGFYPFEARSRASALGHARDRLGIVADCRGGKATLATLWRVYDDLAQMIPVLMRIEYDALERHNADRVAIPDDGREGGAS